MKRAIILILVMVVLSFSGACHKAPPPIKIKRMSALNQDIAVGTRVEFTGWLNEVAGDAELGYELNVSETAGNYPLAMVDMKEGQREPDTNKQICVRAELVNRDESNGSVVYRLKLGEVIDCY